MEIDPLIFRLSIFILSIFVGSNPKRCGAIFSIAALAPSAKAGRYAGPSGHVSPIPV